MFTTGNHVYLYISLGLFLLSFILALAKIRKAGFAVFLAGFVVYSLYLAGRGWIAGFFMPNPIVEGPFLLPWCLGVITLIAALRRDGTWRFVLALVLLFTAYAAWYAKGIIPPTPNKLTLWMAAFFLTEVFAHASFYAAACFAAAHLAGRLGPESFHDLLVWGFVSFSVAQVVGAVWCYLGWGNTFQWGPRHMSSAAIWLIYAAYIHLRYVPGWSARRRAWYVIAAAAVVLAVTNSSYLHEMTFPRIGG